jgi:regulator of cell morphogenesis and NO signaling
LELFHASERSQTIQPFHCGTVQSPIQAMMMDHDDEMSRHARIAELTNDYTAPEGADEDYQKALAACVISAELLEHIWMENGIVFPGHYSSKPPTLHDDINRT